MEFHRDLDIFDENGISRRVSEVKSKHDVADTAVHYPRTPLMDVKNKRSREASGMKPSRKFSIDSSCTSQDFFSQLVSQVPKKQERNTKSRKSCFAVFNVPEDFSAIENRTVGVTLPQAIDEEPETFTLQNQIPLRDVSEVGGATNMRSFKSKSVAILSEVLNSEDADAHAGRAFGTTLPQTTEEEPEVTTQENQILSYDLSGAARTSMKSFKSKSVASLYEVLNSTGLDVHTGRAFGATLPQTTQEEPEMIITQQSQMLSGLYALSGATRPIIGRLRSKSDESLYETVAFKDSLESTAAVATLPHALEDDPEMTTLKQMLLDSCELDRAVSSGIGGLVSKADVCLSETAFRDLDLHKNIAGRANLHVMEGGPEITALQTPVLSGVHELSTETTGGMRNVNSQIDKSQRETLTSSGSQSRLSVGELDFDELTEIRKKACVDPGFSLIPSCSQDFDNYDSHTDDVTATVIDLCEMKAVGHNATASVCLPVMSQVGEQVDILESRLLEGSPANFSENCDASTSGPENTISNRMSLDHQYTRASVTNTDNNLQSQLTVKSLVTAAAPCTSISPNGVGNLERQHSSTPKSAANLSTSTFQGFITPRLSSSFEFMNISNSSFQEELQKTDLEDLIQSYLFQNPVPRMDLSPVAEVHDKNQSNCRASSPDDRCSDVLKSPVVYSCTNQTVDMMRINLGSDKFYNVGTHEESKLQKNRRDSSVNFLGNSSVLFVTNKIVENDFMPDLDATHSSNLVAASYLTQDSVDKDFPEIHRDISSEGRKLDVNQEMYGTDPSGNLKGSHLNQEMFSSHLSENMLNHINQVIDKTYSTDEKQDSQVTNVSQMVFANKLQDSDVNEVNQVDFLNEPCDNEVNQVDFPNELCDNEVNKVDFPNEDEENYYSNLPGRLQVSEANELNQMDFPNKLKDASRIDCLEIYQNYVSSDDCVSEVGDHLSHEGFYVSSAEHFQILEPSAGKFMCERMCEPLILDDNQICAGTNTPDIVLTDECVQTDQLNLVNTCVLTDGCLVHDVSVLTDQQNLVSTSMLTDGCLVRDVSVLANVCQGIDVSMITDACNGLDVSMVTDRVDMLEHSVMVFPECQTQETMTERQMMVDTASFMTPLKLNKQGKRLTAEEVRRQHPRIVANQLDTLMASNQRLQKEVDTAVHSRDSLKSVLVEAKSKLANADKQLNEEKDRQGGVISIIEQYHQKTVAGLESAIKNKEDMIDSLQSEHRDLKLKYEKAQWNLKSLSVDLEEKCAQLDKFKSETENHIAEETKKLQSQFEESNYYHAFLASQQMIKEMQAEQEEFNKLIDDFEHSALIQCRLQDLLPHLISKSQKVAKDHASIHERLTKEKLATQKQLMSLQTDLDVALSENKDLHEDIQNINDILKRSHENYTELQTTYQSAKQDISQSQAQVAELNNKIEFGFKIVKDLMKVKADLTDQLSEQQERNSLQEERLKSAEQEIQTLTQQLERERQLMFAKNDYYEQVIADHEASKSTLEKYIENLRNTLDSWEVDRDVQAKEVDDCQEQLAKQRAKMEEMSKELQSLRKVKAVTQPERDYYQEMRNTSKFLEAEKQLYLEALTDCRTRLEAEVELAASNNKLIDALRSNNTELQQSNDQLLSDLQMLEETLSLKTLDIDTSCAAMDNLQEKMESVLSSLQQKLSLEVKPDNSLREMFFTPGKPPCSLPGESSLFTQILSASKARQPMSHSTNASFGRLSVLQSTSVNQESSNSFRADEAEKARLKQNNVQFGALQPRFGAQAELYLSPRNHSFHVTSLNSRMLTDSKKPLAFSSASKVTFKNQDVSQSLQHPQTSVRKDLSRLYPTTEQNVSTPGYAKICSIPSTVDRTLENMARAKGDNSRSMSMVNSSLDDASSCLESDSMLARVQHVDRLFSLILKTADMAQKASDLTVKDLKEDIILLEDKLKFHRCQSKDLQTDLEQKSSQLASAKSQIQELNIRMREKTQSLMTLQDQQHQVMRLEEEKAELNRIVRALREEVKLLSEQLNEVLQKCDDVKAGQKSEGACVREIVNLKKKNHELVMKLFDERDKSKEVGEKAMRRLKVLDINWRKAEAEVKKFDELVEQIRETCISSQAQSTHPVILQVVRLIDGVE